MRYDCAMQNLFVRISDETRAYLNEVAAKSGLPLARVVDTLLAEARRLGWTAEQDGAKVVPGNGRTE